jgi:hypothetical protein
MNSEQHMAEERFNKADDFSIDDSYMGCVGVDRERIYLADESFTVAEARRLRDWLNMVIP